MSKQVISRSHIKRRHSLARAAVQSRPKSLPQKTIYPMLLRLQVRQHQHHNYVVGPGYQQSEPQQEAIEQYYLVDDQDFHNGGRRPYRVELIGCFCHPGRQSKSVVTAADEQSTCAVVTSLIDNLFLGLHALRAQALTR